MSMTYDELKQAIQDYTENDETSFVNNLPLFIRLAEERILKSVQLNLFQKNQGGTMTSGNQWPSRPMVKPWSADTVLPAMEPGTLPW